MPVRKPNDTVSHIQWALLMYLYHCNDTDYRPFRSTSSYLARVLHAGRSTIIDSLAKLQEAGFLKSSRQNEGYSFILNASVQAVALVMSLAQDEVKHPQNEKAESITTSEWDIVDLPHRGNRPRAGMTSWSRCVARG